MTVTEETLDVYATVVAEIAAGKSREEALGQHALTDDAFVDLERDVEEEVSRAMEHAGHDVPPFFQRYEAAMRNAQLRALGKNAVSLDQFARAVAAVQRPGDPVQALERLGLQPADLVRALGQWGERLSKDPELAARFEEIRTGKKR